MVAQLDPDEAWCPTCGGLGFVDKEGKDRGNAPRCQTCGGTGTVDEETAESHDNCKG